MGVATCECGQTVGCSRKCNPDAGSPRSCEKVDNVGKITAKMTPVMIFGQENSVQTEMNCLKSEQMPHNN
jgi:hypothetical protein